MIKKVYSDRKERVIVLLICIILSVLTATILHKRYSVLETNIDVIDYLVNRNLWGINSIEEHPMYEDGSKLYRIRIKHEDMYVYVFNNRDIMDRDLIELGRSPGKSSITFYKENIATVYYSSDKKVLHQLESYYKIEIE